MGPTRRGQQNEDIGQRVQGRPNRGGKCDSVGVVPVAECLACQEQAVIPRELWLCRPHEERKEAER